MNAAVLKAELYKLERRACAIEETVYKQLKALDFKKDGQELHNAEQRIIFKLWKLDEIQDEIDCITALLKEAGELQPHSYAGNVYQYNPPKQPKPQPLKRTAPKARLTQHRSSWHTFSEQLGEDGRFTAQDVAEKLDTPMSAVRSKIKHWQGKGLIETAEKNGRNVIYRRIEKDSQPI